MTRIQRIGAITLTVLVAAGSIMPTFLSGAAPGHPATTAPGARSPQAVISDLRDADEKVRGVMPSLVSLADADFRKENAAKIIPPMKQMLGYFGELEKLAPNDETKESVRQNKYRLMSYLATLGDKETLTALDTAAKGTGKEAVSAKSSLALVSWFNTGKDAAAQNKVLDDVAALAKENPESVEVGESLGFMANVGVANNDVSKKALEIMRTTLKGDEAKAMLAEMESGMAQKELVGKAFAVEGRTSTGGKFSSESLKGKVVLVDFWATWCGPCIGELPNVKKAYADFHEKGFEIVGVSCDTADDVLNSFTKENSMPWVQLREESQSEAERWHPLAKRYGVDGIPQMFLIDKQGVLRYVDAREDLAEKVKKLVAETPAEGAKPASK